MMASNGTSTVLKYLIALALIMIPAFSTTQVASAQDTGLIDDETYVSELTGEEITWSTDWVVDEEQVTAESDFESFLLEGENGFLYVTYLDGVGDDIEATLSNYLEGFVSVFGDGENVDSGDAGDGFFSLDLVDDGESEFAFFSEVADVDGVTRINIAATTPEAIEDHVADAKASVEFEGAEAFENFDSVTESSVEVATQPDDEEPVEDDEDVTPTEEDEEPVEDDEDVTPTEEDEEPVEDDEGGNTDFSDATSYTFELNDAVVEWQDPWAFEPDLNYVETDYESIGFVSGTSFQSIIYLPTGVDLDAARDAFLEGFVSDDVEIQVLDRGSYANDASDVSYSLDLTDIDGTLFGLFTVYIDDGDNVLAYATLALADDLGESLDLAKETITINSEAVYNGVTGGGLQDLIDANSDSFTPTDTVQPDDDTDNTDDNDDPTPVPDDDDVDPDAQDYLDTVRDSYDELDSSVDRFDELVNSGELSDADIDELLAILDLWNQSALDADAIDAPDGYEDLHTIYLEYTAALQDASLNFILALSSEAESDEQAEAFASFDSARINADEYGVMLDELLTDAGV